MFYNGVVQVIQLCDMAKEFLSIRCSDDILKAIKELEKATGKSRTETVEGLLRQALGLAEPADAISGLTLDERIEAIFGEKFEAIARQANGLVQQYQDSVQQTVQQLENRVEALEKLEA